MADPRGDLYIVLRVRPHKFFEREGNDLHCLIPISFPQAALGAEITITTLDGEAKVRIPEGTQSGQEFRMRGKGVPHLNEHGRGDLVAQIIVRTPGKLNKAQKELLRQLGETIDGGEHADLAQPARESEGDVLLRAPRSG